MPKRAKGVSGLVAQMQIREDRERARRVERIKRGIAGANFRDDELTDLEEIIFRAYGRAKLG